MKKFYHHNKDSILQDYISSRIGDPWVDTFLQGYKFLDNKQKGVYGELYVSSYMEKKGYNVSGPLNTGHDKIIAGFKTEIKFSVSGFNYKKNSIIEDSFTINHLSSKKDWDRMIFVGINHPFISNKNYFKWMSKEDFQRALKVEIPSKMSRIISPYFKRQQGGHLSANDDYMAGKNCISKLIKDGFLKDISEW